MARTNATGSQAHSFAGLMKRTGTLAAALVASVALVACAPSGSSTRSEAPASAGMSEAQEAKPVVATTFTVLADIARNVAGEHLEVVSITKEGAEIHGYEPTPQDIAAATRADLVIDNGMGLELWFEKFIAEVNVPHIVASDGIDAIPIAEDAYAGRDNPHAWMSPTNAKIYVDNMARAFGELDPEHSADFAANAEAYKAKLDGIHQEMLDALSVLPESQRALVTCEGAFSYLAKDGGLTEEYLWAVNAENQATPNQVAQVIDFVKANDVPAVFCESTVSDAPMQQVVDATDAVFGGTLYVDSLSAEDGPVPTYLDLIAHDVRTITEALTGSSR